MSHKTGLFVFLMIVLILVSACNIGDLFAPQATNTPTSTETRTPLPTLTPSATKTLTVTQATLTMTTTVTRTFTKAPTTTITRTRTVTPITPVASCEITALTATTAYTRPSLAADIFGTVSGGMKLTAMVKTTDNWYGFDPGVAQAGNVGVFRFRWVKAGPSLSISPICNNLKVLDKTPLPGICYVMSMGTTPVRATPSASAALVYTFTLGDYAQALGRSGNWIKINMAVSNISGLSVPGWVQQDLVGLNGCPTPLPTIVP